MTSIAIPVKYSLTNEINQYLLKQPQPIQLKQFLEQSLEQATFLPIYGMSEEQKLEHRTIFTNISIDNNQNLGTVIGMTILGMIGFLALGFTLFGAIGGGVLGIVLGRYIGRKIQKKISNKGIHLCGFDLFAIRIKCLIKWCKLSVLKQKDINGQRFTVQRLLTEIKPLLHYKYFDPKYKTECLHLIKKLQLLLQTNECLYSLCISFKLTKEFIHIIEKKIIYSKFSNQQILIVLQETVADVFRPFHTLYLDSIYAKKNPLIQHLINKIQKLMLHPIVLQSQELYYDQELTIPHIKEFSANLGQNIKIQDLEKYLSNQYIQGIKQNQSIQPNLDKIRSPQRRKSAGDQAIEILSSYDINDENQAQHPLIMFQRKKAKSFDQNLLQFTQNEFKIENQLQKSQFQSDQVDQNQLQKHQYQHQHQHSYQLQQQQQQQQDHPLKNSQFSQQNPILKKKSTPLEIVVQDCQDVNSRISGLSQQFITKQDQPHQLSSELEQKFTMLINLMKEPIEDWEIVLKKENLIIYRTFKQGNPAVFVKGHADLMGVKKDILFKAISNEEYRKKWDKILVNFHVVEKESADVDVIYYYVQSPFGVANREFCQKRITKYDFPNVGQTSLIYFSVDNKNAPLVKGHVRAETLISGYVLEDIKGGCRLQFCTNNDVKGNIPKSLVNFVASRAPVSWINSLKQGCLDHDKIMIELEKSKNKKK